MTHRFPIKEIALQAGLSTATIDRVINNRAHVSPQTRVRVTTAIAELEAQESQLSARGRRMFFDFVIEAPKRFSREVQKATEQVANQINIAACRPRFVAQEIMEEQEVIDALNRIAKKGSQGVCLKARDLPNIRAAVDRLTAQRIPVVTLVTDLKTSDRIAYVGIDNHSAGRTAAYLVATAIPNIKGNVLALRSNESFLGEEEREIAFIERLYQLRPKLHVHCLSGGSGVHYETSRILRRFSENFSDLQAVYSMGGGNRTILEFLKGTRLEPNVFIGHDLDADNRDLLQEGDLNYILAHDLKSDMRKMFHTFLRYHKLLTHDLDAGPSNIQIISPENVPPVSI